MVRSANKPAPAPVPATAEAEAPPVDDASARVQAQFDEAHAKGYVGVVPDETPNSHYTLAGVLAGMPTPETTPSQ